MKCPRSPYSLEWYWHDDAPSWPDDDDPQLLVTRLTRLFEQPELALDCYSPEQVGLGLNYLISGAISGSLIAANNRQVSIVDRIRLIRSIEPLFSKCFSRICSREVDGTDSWADHVCVMFWDIAPLWPNERCEKNSEDYSDSLQIDQA